MGIEAMFLPLTWYPISDLPEAWKASDIALDLWVDQGRHAEERFVRCTDCRFVEDCWMEVSDTRYRPVSGTPTHFMRVEGPQS